MNEENKGLQRTMFKVEGDIKLEQARESINKGEMYFNEDSPIVSDPEEKEYLLLYYCVDENGDDYDGFHFAIGRSTMIDYIKTMIDNVDVFESSVLVSNVKLENRIRLIDFLIKCNTVLPEEEQFDLSEYMENKEEVYPEDK